MTTTYSSRLGGPAQTQEELMRAKELLSRIYAMLRPLVENLVRPLVLQQLANPSQELTKEQEQMFMDLPEDGLTQEGKELFRELKQGFLSPKPLTNEEIEEEVNGAVVDEMELLVNGWFKMFFCVKLVCDGLRYVQANTIDDAMLPHVDKDSHEAFQKQFMNTILDESQALAILRQARASLPVGKVLPDEMVKLLALWRVKIV